MNKKFPPALGAVVGQALKDKSARIGKTVQDITCEDIEKSGLSQEDITTNLLNKSSKRRVKMKLNEKALKRIQDEMEHGEYQIPCGHENVEGMSIYHLEEHEFEPDDFEGGYFQNGKDHMICLTVEEAKEIYKVLDMGLEACIHEYEREWEFNPERQVRRAFKEKIEQAEVAKIGEDYNKALNNALAEFQKQGD